jgi:MFS family permease
MYGASVFLIQYFQLSRGHSPSRAGMLTIPMMAGILISSILAGRLVSRTGRLKPFLVAGTSSLTAGFALLGLIDEHTPILLIGVAMVLIGAGVGMTAQNFVLIVQNAVPLKDMGASSATVTFFRTMGGTIGVAVLGAVFARQVAGHLSSGAPYAYGVASAHVFLISASVAAIGVVAALLFKPVTLRASLELATAVPAPVPPAASSTDLAAAA